MPNPTEEQLKVWERKWKTFHDSCPDVIYLSGSAQAHRETPTIALYRDKRESGVVYTPMLPPKPKKKWWWPF